MEEYIDGYYDGGVETKYVVAGIGLVVLLVIVIIVIYYSVFAKKKQSSPPAPLYPSGLKEGQSIKCAEEPGIYRLEGGVKRWYSSWDVYVNNGAPAPVIIPCTVVHGISDGAPITQ